LDYVEGGRNSWVRDGVEVVDVDGAGEGVGNVKGMVRGVCMSFLDCVSVLVSDFFHASQSDDA
jgi:hypothetical protein